MESVKAQLKELMAVPQPLVTDLHMGVSRTPDVLVPQWPPAPAPVFTPTDVGYVPPVPVPGSKSHYLIDQDPTVTLTDLIARMSSAIVAGKMTQAVVAEMCNKHGVSEFMLLSNRPDLLPLIDADMKAMGV